MITITIEWGDTHHPGDDYNMIASHLAAGLDEGPMLVVDAGGRRGPDAAPEAQIFTDVQSYLAHLAAHEGELEGDRWVGLVRDISGGDTSHALAALYDLKKVVGPSRSRGRSQHRRGGAPATHDYAVLPGPFVSKEDLTIENSGDGFIEVAHAFPAMKETMTCISDEEW